MLEKIPKINETKLNEGQKKVVEYIHKYEKIKRGEYAKLCGCSIRTAFNDLKNLVKKGILKRVGTTGRYTYYTLKSNVQSKQDKNK